MIVLRRPDAKTASLMPKAAFEGGFVLSCFVIRAELPDGSMLYNTLTGEIVRLDKTEWPEKELAEHHFIVPADRDEFRLCRSIRGSLGFFRDARFAGYRHFTILTTTDCNARCFYCYQRGCEHISMSDEDADKTADFILRSKDPGRIRIRWFGGEPLYNRSAIDRICLRLDDAGAQFESEIITNGYLFDETVTEKAVASWRLKVAQISIDGMPDVYNRRKAFIYYDDPNAFETVMRGTEQILNAGVKVNIRLNADSHNIDDLKELCLYLDDRFRNFNKLTIYTHPLFSVRLNASTGDAAKARKLFYSSLKELNDLINGLGRCRSDVPGSIKVFNCMADSPESITIMPDGRTHACEQFNANHYLGTISGGEPKAPDLPFWRELYPDHEECKNCALLPLCVKIKHCPDIDEECIPEEREINIEKLRNSLIRKYGNK